MTKYIIIILQKLQFVVNKILQIIIYILEYLKSKLKQELHKQIKLSKKPFYKGLLYNICYIIYSLINILGVHFLLPSTICGYANLIFVGILHSLVSAEIIIKPYKIENSLTILKALFYYFEKN